MLAAAAVRSFYPTLSYGAADGKGDLISTSNGAWGNAEFGYNPLNNNLGGSVSTGTAGSTTLGGNDVIGIGTGEGSEGKGKGGWAGRLLSQLQLLLVHPMA
jgi:hypothetical protein